MSSKPVVNEVVVVEELWSCLTSTDMETKMIDKPLIDNVFTLWKDEYTERQRTVYIADNFTMSLQLVIENTSENKEAFVLDKKYRVTVTPVDH